MSPDNLRTLPLSELHQEHTRRYQEHQRVTKQLQAARHVTPRHAQQYRESRNRVEETNNELLRRDREAAKAYYKRHHHAP